MTLLAQTCLIYTGIVAITGGMVHTRGRERQMLAPFEFLFLFMPLLMLLAMGYHFFGSVDALAERSGIWTYFWILQTISAAVMGGFALMPRYFVKAETLPARVLVNTLGGLTISLLFGFSRVFLFALSAEPAMSSPGA